VKIFGAVSLPILSKLREGFVIEGTKVRPEAVRVIKQLKTKTWLEFRLREGKNREIRRICEAAGLTIDKLKRVAIANLSVDDIRPGSYMFITKKDLLKGLEGGESKDIVYKSKKRSINISKRGIQPVTSADDRAFTKFRKETYFETVKELKERKLDAKKVKEAKFFKN
jgi:23S rRNA pseudouridine2605 synthase